MAHKSVGGGAELAMAIKERRIELEMTIEEAANLAGVGSKSWSRYEAGEPIRADKCAGVCRALEWFALPGTQEDMDMKAKLQEYRQHEAWSDYLEESFGEQAAMSFAIGSDILLDHVEADLQELAALPRGSHIGQLSYSILQDLLPQQFLMRYDYDFLYLMKMTIIKLISYAKENAVFMAHTVLEELVIYLIVEESSILMDEFWGSYAEDACLDEWLYSLLGDADIQTFLYSDWYVTEEEPYHFNHWMKPQFWCQEGDTQ